MKKLFFSLITSFFTLSLLISTPSPASIPSKMDITSGQINDGQASHHNSSDLIAPDRDNSSALPFKNPQLGQERDGKMIDVAAGTSGGARAGKDFTRAGKKKVIESNKQAHGGNTVCEHCSVQTVPAKKSVSGVKPPRNETQVDHIYPKSKGGDGSPSNGQVLCRSCNREKSNK